MDCENTCHCWEWMKREKVNRDEWSWTEWRVSLEKKKFFFCCSYYYPFSWGNTGVEKKKAIILAVIVRGWRDKRFSRLLEEKCSMNYM